MDKSRGQRIKKKIRDKSHPFVQTGSAPHAFPHTSAQPTKQLNSRTNNQGCAAAHAPGRRRRPNCDPSSPVRRSRRASTMLPLHPRGARAPASGGRALPTGTPALFCVVVCSRARACAMYGVCHQGEKKRKKKNSGRFFVNSHNKNKRCMDRDTDKSVHSIYDTTPYSVVCFTSHLIHRVSHTSLMHFISAETRSTRWSPTGSSPTQSRTRAVLRDPPCPRAPSGPGGGCTAPCRSADPPVNNSSIFVFFHCLFRYYIMRQGDGNGRRFGPTSQL